PQKKAKVGRPRMPKGTTKGRIVPVCFTPEDLRNLNKAAKADKQGLSEWIRKTLRGQKMETWIKLRKDGKQVTFSYRETGRKRATSVIAIYQQLGSQTETTCPKILVIDSRVLAIRFRAALPSLQAGD